MKRNFLSEFEQLVLLAVLRIGEDAYGATIRDDLKETAGRSVSVATIYVALTRLEERKFVSSWMAGPTGVRGGRSRRCYRLEPAGVDALQEARQRLDRMWAGVDPTLDPRRGT